MACIFINNLINCNTEIELVKKFDQIGDYKMINFIFIHAKFQVNHFYFKLIFKKKKYFKAIIEYNGRVDSNLLETINNRIAPMVAVKSSKYTELRYEERKLNLIKSVSYFKF
jgi:hypothetical protein